MNFVEKTVSFCWKIAQEIGWEFLSAETIFVKWLGMDKQAPTAEKRDDKGVNYKSFNDYYSSHYPKVS